MAVEAKGLSKSFGKQQILKGLDLRAEKGEFSAIFGPNGCGKTTLLNILSGLVESDEGEHSLGLDCGGCFSYMFQNYRQTLLPWMSNFDNLALPLKIRGMAEEGIKAAVEDIHRLYGSGIALDAYPYTLSGGLQQRLSMLRAIITEPDVLLLDEPTSSLDFESSLLMRQMLLDYHGRMGTTILIVTHDIEEAAQLGRKIFVFGDSPTHVTAVVDNPLHYPRATETLYSPKLNKVKAMILESFMDRVS
jgi:NitT/TauT family transport system ATP-binding protein